MRTKLINFLVILSALTSYALSSNALSSTTAKPDNTIKIQQVSHQHSANTPLTLSHQVKAGNNRILIVAIASEGGKQMEVLANNIRMNRVPNSISNIKSGSTNSTTAFYYLLEKNFPGTGAINIAIDSDATDLNVGAITFTGVKQQIPQALTTVFVEDQKSINADFKTLVDESLVIDLVSAGHGYTHGHLTMGKKQTLLWKDGDSGKSGSSGNSSYQLINKADQGSVQWYWNQKEFSLNRASLSVIALEPEVAASSIIDAGANQHFYSWHGYVPEVTLEKPGYLESIKEPATETAITRISDKDMDGYNGNPDTLMHMYSKDQAWNADMSLYKLKFGQIRDSKSHKFITYLGKDPSTGFEYKEILWSTTDSDKLYGLRKNTLNRYSVKDKKWEVLNTFEGFGLLTTNYEGNLSIGDQYIVLNDGVKLAVYDIKNNQITASMPVPENLDWVSVSQSGKFVVVNRAGQGVYIYDNTLKFLLKLADKGEHADLGYDAAGNEVFVQACPAKMIRLKDAVETDLLGVSYGCGHVSTRNFKKPGWAYYSIRKDENDTPYGDSPSGEILAVKLDQSNTVFHLGHHRSDYTKYDSQPKVSVSPDGSKLVFNSDWQEEKGMVFAYMQDIPTSYSTTLSGSFSHPEKPEYTTLWGKVSGPGDVSFDKPDALETAVHFTKNGRYALALTIKVDEKRSYTDHVEIQIGQ